MSWRGRVRAFFRNDVDYAPFGIGLLRGVTPARLGVVAALCLTLVVINAHWAFATVGFRPSMWTALGRGWARDLLAALPLMFFIVWADRLAAKAPWKVQVGAFALATLVGAAAFAAIKTGLVVLTYGVNWRAWPHYPLIPGHFYYAAVAGGLLSAVLFFVAREKEAARKLMAARLARVATERQIAEARLQLLRAQIEPHFLFNSLASVKRLYEQEPRGGRHMLRNLSIYLRAAVDRGREETTLADQVAMARSFLEIFKQRMGERLQVRFDIPAELQLAVVPSFMLGTLVENALKHGIGPKGTGGSIGIAARAENGCLIMEVSDDGLGFQGESGTGVGLANTRARLDSLYPGKADLELRRNAGGGITAAITLPLRTATVEPQLRASAAIPEARADLAPAADSFTRRFARILTWKHWAWAIGAGIAVAGFARLRAFASAFDMFGAIWLKETYLAVGAACLFMLAIVVVEAARPGSKAPPGWAHLVGWLAAAAVVGGIAWAFPIEATPRDEKDPRYQRFIAQTKKASYNHRVASLFGSTFVIIVNGALGTLVYVWLRNARRASEALAREEIERAEAERKLLASRLERVEAEVDPGFMFSTLETIENTYDRDRATADAMLDELIAFLRAAIPRLRGEEAAPAAALPQTA